MTMTDKGREWTNTQCTSADNDLSNWKKYKPQVVRVPNAVSVVYIVN